MPTKRTTKNKTDTINAAIGNNRPERLSLAESRDILYEKFYSNIRLLIATETISMVDLSRKLNLKSGTRLYDMSYGRAVPTLEELIAIASHYNCTIDDLLNNEVVISWKENK